jgi:hypothetical protein
MFKRLGPLEIWCDAPPYQVVRACEKCGFPSALDVRWCRMSHVINGAGQCKDYFGIRLWRWFWGTGEPKRPNCICGQPLPEFKRYGFSLQSQQVADYFLGQCRRCRTIFWDVAVPLPAWIEGAGQPTHRRGV